MLPPLVFLAQVAQPAAPPPTPTSPSAAHVAPSLVPVRTPKPPSIDGNLSDPVWALAAKSSAFTQKFPVEGAAPSERTTVRVLYDDDAIYVAFDVEQKTAPIVARMARRDRFIESDSVSIDIDSRGLGKTAFEFKVTAAGVLLDGIRSNDASSDGAHYSSDWDENWDARTVVRKDGWSAEMRIPLRVLRFSPSSVQTWGFQARRYTSMRQETDEWSLVPREVVSEVSLYGHLTDVRVRPHSDLELRPFVLGRLVRRDPTNLTLESGVKLGASAGLDLRWHITPDLTLDGTVAPDFTQVEGDEPYLNLTNFESFYPEKRPFFVEGAEIFEAPAPVYGGARAFQLLYTRRIGRRPDPPTLRPAPAVEQLVALPETSTILGATKLVGRLGNSWWVGAMSAVTGANTVEVQEAGGVRRDRLVDPTTLFQVLRLKHDFEDGKAHVGFLGTSVVRAEETRLYPTYTPTGAPGARAICPTGEELTPGSRCTHDGYAGSIDGVWRSADGEILLSGETIGSVMKNGPQRTLRDGTVIGDGDAGYGLQLIAAREGGSGLAWDVQYQYASRKLDFNDLGFMERQNHHFYYGSLEYRTFKPVGPTIETKSLLEMSGRYNLDLVKVSRKWLLDTYVTYANFWTSYLEFNIDEQRFDDREIGNGRPFERPARLGIELQGYTDRRRDVYVGAALSAQQFDGGGNIYGRVYTTFRLHPQLELEIDPSASYTAGEPRFAAFGATPNEMVFGALSASSFATTARLNFAITPRLALQTFAQLFLASGHYDDFRSYVSTPGDTAMIRLSRLTPTAAPTASPDFIDVSLNTNFVLRWEYSLGSVLYLVFNRSQTPANPLVLDQPATLSFVPLGRAPAVDTVLLKWQLYVSL